MISIQCACQVIEKKTNSFTATITFAADTMVRIFSFYRKVHRFASFQTMEVSKVAAENAVEASNETQKLKALNQLDRVRNAVGPVMDILGVVATVRMSRSF